MLGKLSKKILVYTLVASLVFLPTNKVEAKMNGMTIISLGLAVAALAINIAEFKINKPICFGSPSPDRFIACMKIALIIPQIAMILLLIKGAKKAKSDTQCEGDDCFSAGGPPNEGDDSENPIADPEGDPAVNNAPPPGISNRPPGVPDNVTPEDIINAGGIDLGGIETEIDTTSRLLGNEGFQNNKDGSIKTPRGTINPASLSSPAGMAAAGFSPSEIDSLSSFQDDMEKKTQDKAQEILSQLGVGASEGDFASAGAGGGSRAAAGGFDPNSFLKRIQQKEKPSVGGLTRKAGNDTVGVAAGDSVFKVLTEKYQADRTEKMFLPGP